MNDKTKVIEGEVEKSTDLVEKQETQLIAADITPDSMLNMAVKQGADIESIRELLKLKREWEADEAKKAYVAAMNKFKANPPAIFKDKTVSYNDTSYTHASLANIVKTIGQALAEHNLSHRWDMETLDKGTIKVTCVITHELGHSESVPLEAGADNSGGKNNIQAKGSTITYLQRYTLLAATGLSTFDMDDDGATSELPAEDQSQVNDLPSYPQEMLDANIEKWRKLITEGKSSAPHIVGMVSTKYKLSTDQKLTIANLEPQGEK